jgi:hypothetical protein
MRRFFRPRLSLLWLMVIVAAIATLLAWERSRRIAALRVDLRSAEDRLEWAGRMHRRGYVSKSQLAAEQQATDRLRAQLEWLGDSPKHP